MNRKMFFSIILTSVTFASCLNGLAAFSAQKNFATFTSWEQAYISDFKPSWDCLPSLQKTYTLFSDVLPIPEDAQKNEQDSSVVFNTVDGRVTLFSNGVMRTDKADGSVDFFDVASSALCSVSASGEINASHLNPALMNSCGVSVEDGELLFRSFKIVDADKKKLNVVIRLRDGFSFTFKYLNDGTIVVRESLGAVEVVDPADKVSVDILKAHGMISSPSGAFYTLEGLLSKDGEGVTCYVLDGMKFHVDANGLKFCASVPTVRVQLEGLVAGDMLLTRWKLGEGLESSYKKCRFQGFDILFDANSGRSLLYVNLLTLHIGLFFYDEQGNYCRRTGVGSVRYGKIAPMLTYDGVRDAIVQKSLPPEGHVLSRGFKPKVLQD